MRKVKLSDFVKKYRKMNLLRQIDLADKLEMSKVQVGRIESGKTISLTTMRKLSQVMDVDPEMIYAMYREEKSKEEYDEI
ncbi:MAG: XRE family transcriptional regulator [Erysipelotrichia bacterium]|nr:XRE family transcriptional regulator [Erysipelotrichia bacterium]